MRLRFEMPLRGVKPSVNRGSAYWLERIDIVVKAVVASVTAWAVARYLFGHPQPVFAPLAALLGVYPTVIRSLRESVGYAAGFLVGAGLAIPVGVLLGSEALGIGVLLVVALLASEMRWLFGGQASQVTVTALFVLLFGGHEVVSYVLPKVVDVAAGLAIGLVASAVVFPPVRLRWAQRALFELRDDVADSTDLIADLVTDDEDWWSRWQTQEQRLVDTQSRTHQAYTVGRESLRANPRARLRGYRHEWQGVSGEWPPPRMLNALDRTTASLRSIASSLREANDLEDDTTRYDPTFRHDYADLLRRLAGLIRELPEVAAAEDLNAVAEQQERLESPHRSPGTDGPGLWDPQKELLRMSRHIMDDFSSPLS